MIRLYSVCRPDEETEYDSSLQQIYSDIEEPIYDDMELKKLAKATLPDTIGQYYKSLNSKSTSIQLYIVVQNATFK